MTKPLRGTTVVLIAPDCGYAAAETDFGHPGGGRKTRRRAQTLRAERALVLRALRDGAHPRLEALALSSEGVDLLRHVLRLAGWTFAARDCVEDGGRGDE